MKLNTDEIRTPTLSVWRPAGLLAQYVATGTVTVLRYGLVGFVVYLVAAAAVAAFLYRTATRGTG